MTYRSGLMFVMLLLVAGRAPTDAACHSERMCVSEAGSGLAGRCSANVLLPLAVSGSSTEGSAQYLCCGSIRTALAWWLANGRFELERALQELEAAGVETSLAEIRPPQIPDEENAALIYRKVWDLLQAPPPEVLDVARSLRKTPIALWPRDEKRKLAGFVASQSDAIDLTLKATRYSKCSFGLDYSEGFAMQMPHLAKMRSLARLLLIDTTAKLGEGDIEGAIESALAMRTIGRHAGSDPILISRLVELACIGLAQSALESVLKLGYPDTRQLSGLLARLDQEPPNTSLRDVLETETCAGIDAYEQIRSGRISPSEMAGYVEGGPGDGWKSDLESALGPLLWGWFADRDQAMYLDTMRRYIELADKPYFAVKAAIEDLDANRSGAQEWISPLSQIITPALQNAFAAAARSEARYQLERLGVALMIFGQEQGSFPDALDELVPEYIAEMPIDPFSGKPYVYKNEDGRFLIYSLDVNMVDDNGIPSSEVGRDNGDIVFRFAAKP